ncbi:MAG: S8 family serine peptidase [Vicinamibacterales bacterium]
MSNKALITRRPGTAPEPAQAPELPAVQETGVIPEADTSAGMLVRGTDSQFEALEAAGYRVKVLPDTNLLRIGRYTIDVETNGEPDVPRELDVSEAELPGWPHHLVQLAGPPLDAWVRAIEARGLDVVEPVSGYALFVSAPTDAVTALRDLPFVVWTGPLKPAYRISANATANVEYVSVGVYSSSEAGAVRAAIEAAGGRIFDEARQPAVYGGEYAIFRVQGAAIEVLARVPHARWVEPVPRMELDGERESQIVAENLDGTAAPATAPVPGYQNWLGQVGVDGSGVTIAIVDSGVDANANNASAVAHADLRGRQAAFVDYSAGTAVTDTVGHGTHVAGIALGNAATAQTEAAAPGNFLWGQGVAPGARYVTQNALDGSVYPRPSFATLAEDSVRNGAQVMNNSWGGTNDGGDGYVAQCREVDLAVRDPNATTPTLESLAVVFSAGNSGGRPQSITTPHEAKNAIIVGNSLTSRPGQGFPSEDIRGIAGTSSRGPAVDTRILPTIVAPGTDVSAAFSRTATIATPIPGTGRQDPANPAVTIDQYTSLSGTSMAAPQVAGACAVITEWWRNRTGGKTPSPAMLKALLVNSAENLAGGENWKALNAVQFDKDRWAADTANVFRRQLTFVPNAVVEVNTLLTQVTNAASITSAGQWAFDAATSRIFVRMLNSGSPGSLIATILEARDGQPVAHIPNNDQGWGRLNLTNILLQSPASDRGPGIYSDQRHAFIADGQELLIKVAPVDTTRPLRITLAWTDAAGPVNTSQARMNDLDLEVREVNTGRIFKGNVFQSGFSVTGGLSDSRNNVECVYVRQPSGVYEVRVIAWSLLGSANPAITSDWQDFALVIDNADVPDAAPVNVATVLDRSGSMIFFDYVDITRICTRQAVDLMGVGDHVGLVSFGDDARVEFPVPGTAVAEITGQPVKDTAMAAVTNVAFGGCTAMGDGIASAAALLSASPSPRAIVLFSDGYDNKGCAPPGSTRPSALQAAQALPADVRLFSCAMGPASDQALLESLATETSGRYYFMPAIDELFEVYNYIRGQVSGTSIVVNQTGQASSSVVPAFVDAAARAATFTVAWADAGLRPVLGNPQKAHEVGVRLVDPRGRVVPEHASFVRRHVADTFIVFRIEDPAPGRWHVQVQTLEQTHVAYTAGVFVDSPLRLVIATYPRRVRVGDVVQIGAVMLDGPTAFAPGRASMTTSAPRLGLKQEIRRWRRDLNKIDPPSLDGDTLPADVARLAVLNTRLKKGEVFARGSAAARLLRARFPWDKALPRRRSAVTIDPNAPTLVGNFQPTQQGSYNFTLTLSGVTPSGLRFVRTDRLGIVAR